MGRERERGGAAISRLGWVLPLADLSQKAPTSPVRPPLPLLPRLRAQTPCVMLCPCAQAVRPAHQLATERHYANGRASFPLSLSPSLSLSPRPFTAQWIGLP